MPAKGQHRKPRSLNRLTRVCIAAGTGGAALALPLVSVAHASAAEPAKAPAVTAKAHQYTVVRGDTYHFDIVANESSRALMDLSVQDSVCIGNGILTTENDEQAWARARKSEGDKGGFAARAALTMIALKDRLGRGA